MLPRVSLGLWHNFGSCDSFDNMKEILFESFDQGITHFDLANNYGPVPGSAEENLGRIIESDLRPYRDEMVISTKAGFDMWPGPYGDFGSDGIMLESSKGQSYFCPDRSKSKGTDCRQYKDS